MKLDRLTTLSAPRPATVTVALDTSRTDESGEHEVALRWHALRAQLTEAGADDATLDAIAEVVLRPTGHAGSTGACVVARDGVVLHAETLPQAPARDEAVCQGLAHLVPLVRAHDAGARYVLVELDRTGADVTVVDAAAGDAAAEVVTDVESGAGHDVIHKVSSGGWSHRRIQTRAEDSWQQNAGAVAGDLDELVRRHRPELVLVTGDAQARGFLTDQLTPAVSTLVRVVDAGSRHDGPAPGRAGGVHPAVQAAVDDHVHERRRAALADLAEEIGRDGAGVHGLDAVTETLRRGQVREVFLVDDATSPARLWVGADAQLVGTRQELADLGVTDLQQVRADSALVAAAAASDASFTVIPGDPEDARGLLDVVTLVDGVGARLRYADAATPRSDLVSMTRDVGGGTDTTGLT